MYVTGCIPGNCTASQLYPSSFAAETAISGNVSAGLYLQSDNCFGGFNRNRTFNSTRPECHYFIGVFVRGRLPAYGCRVHAAGM